MSTTRTDIPEPDASSWDYEKCLGDYEDKYENYCEGQLSRYLNTPTAMDIDALADEYLGPDPARKKGNGHE